MKSNFALLTLTAFVLPLALHASQIVNIDAQSSAGTSVLLNAGTYQVNVIGTSQGGAYNGWNSATQNFGTAAAAPAPNRWVDSFYITANGVKTEYLPITNPFAADAAGALAAYQSSILYNATTLAPASSILNTVFFTVNSSQSVNFLVGDYLFVDNWGGMSLKLSPVAANATPEPSTFGLMGLAMAGSIAFFRRKFKR